MSNKHKYRDIFIKSRSINSNKYNKIPEGDSISYVTLIFGLEEGFVIRMDTDDIVNFS
jgi:acyl carrier protein